MSDRAPRLLQPWVEELSVQQQSVLALALRGPDGIPKSHVCKDIQRFYRASVIIGAKVGRAFRVDEVGDSFMSLEHFGDGMVWRGWLDAFLHEIDALPHHFIMHLMHGAEIIGYKHPDRLFKERWNSLYIRLVEDCHLAIELESEMDERLNDWGQVYWDAEASA